MDRFSDRCGQMRPVNRYTIFRRAGTLAKLIVVPAFLAFVAVKLLHEPHIRLFRISPILLFAALVVNQIALSLFALRMWLVLRIFNIRISYFQSLRIHLQSMLYYFVVPMTVGLEAARFAKIKERLGGKVQATNLGSALVGDRLIGALAAMLWAAALLPVISIHLVVRQNWKLPIVFAGLICVGCILLILLHSKVRFYALELVKLFHAGRTNVYLSLVIAMLTNLFFSLAVFLASLGTDLQLTFIQALFAISAAMLFIVIPVSFAGVGPAEAAGVGVMAGMGLPIAQAALFTLLIYFARLVAALEGGSWELYEGWREALHHLVSHFRGNRSDYE